jgi:hypothetical protein
MCCDATGSSLTEREVQSISAYLPVEIRIVRGDGCGDAGSRKNSYERFDGASSQLQRHSLQAGQRLNEAHRKQPLDNHGPEKSAGKRLLWSNLEANCAAHGGCFVRRKAREMGVVRGAFAPGEEVCSLAGGSIRIRTRGSCLMLASPIASKTICFLPCQAARASGKRPIPRDFLASCLWLCSVCVPDEAGSLTRKRLEKSLRIVCLPTSQDSN